MELLEHSCPGRGCQKSSGAGLVQLQVKLAEQVGLQVQQQMAEKAFVGGQTAELEQKGRCPSSLSQHRT